jgi:hypothetical protein
VPRVEPFCSQDPLHTEPCSVGPQPTALVQVPVSGLLDFSLVQPTGLQRLCAERANLRRPAKAYVYLSRPASVLHCVVDLPCEGTARRQFRLCTSPVNHHRSCGPTNNNLSLPIAGAATRKSVWLLACRLSGLTTQVIILSCAFQSMYQCWNV